MQLSDIDLLDRDRFTQGVPHEWFTYLRHEAPVYKHPEPGGPGFWVVTKHADVVAVGRDAETYSSHQARGGVVGLEGSAEDYADFNQGGNLMLTMDPPEHTRYRKLVNRGFTPRRVRDTAPHIRRVCDEIIDAVCERGECDFVRDIAAPLPMILIGDMLGVEPEDRSDLLRWSDDMVSAQSGSATEESLMGAMTAFSEYTAYQDRVIADRTKRPTDDLVSVLVHAEVDGDRLEHDEILHESLLILVGGDETTRHVISGGMEQLMLHPDQRQRLLDDPAKIEVAVEEMLRWVSPIKNMCRTVTHDTEFMGQQLSAGQKCMLLYESANRDESKFDDPFRFDVERNPNEHVAFGFGAHFCLGNSLARLELQIMTERLLTRLPDLDFATDPGGLPRRKANFISGLESMPVTFTPSAPIGAQS
jgi:cholest-4-en-3-one 26-monooxygenase